MKPRSRNLQLFRDDYALDNYYLVLYVHLATPSVRAMEMCQDLVHRWGAILEGSARGIVAVDSGNVAEGRFKDIASLSKWIAHVATDGRCIECVAIGREKSPNRKTSIVGTANWWSLSYNRFRRTMQLTDRWLLTLTINTKLIARHPNSVCMEAVRFSFERLDQHPECVVGGASIISDIESGGGTCYSYFQDQPVGWHRAVEYVDWLEDDDSRFGRIYDVGWANFLGRDLAHKADPDGTLLAEFAEASADAKDKERRSRWGERFENGGMLLAVSGAPEHTTQDSSEFVQAAKGAAWLRRRFRERGML